MFFAGPIISQDAALSDPGWWHVFVPAHGSYIFCPTLFVEAIIINVLTHLPVPRLAIHTPLFFALTSRRLGKIPRAFTQDHAIWQTTGVLVSIRTLVELSRSS